MRRGLLDDGVHCRLARGQLEDAPVGALHPHAVESREAACVYWLREENRHVPEGALAQLLDGVVGEAGVADDSDPVGEMLHLVQ